ncbi:protein unc-13 homolog 4B isoform X2 [Drosophila persimilis]|uniref:protein unc-13 homolog 4B isoform X2 n=1 Tax=Drosophila persimilis TaxID=7234 RepID=UPI000F09271D|nr:protein unc-13 homolog 4B isoform X2 [Drosophila persimilis]
MDEEQMWKGFFLKLHELKMNPPTEHEYQLQDGDGGFFEKFGSLLRQKSQLNENILRTPLSSLKEDIQIEENELIIEKPNHADPIDTFVEEILPPWAPTNDIGDTVFDSGTVMNVEDLYEEILFEIYNNIGCENNEGRIESLVGFAQDAFKIPNSTHLEISEVAVRKEPPNVRLNIEIIKAENLLSKDSNGLSDPFVTLYLESRNSHRYNSSVKPATLNPIWEEHFSFKIQLNYSAILYLLYDSKLNEICEPIVKDVCNNIKRLDVPDDQFEYLPKIDNLNMGTTLFELYLVLKRYVQLGKSLCTDELKMSGFYQWFETGVTHWLDISIIKALNRIQKAIDLDQLKAVDETVKYSSSAVDTLSIFYQIKIFWQQLDWPEVEGCYTFIAKIVNDLCRCCIFYAQRMSQRVEKLTKLGDNNKIFILSEEWCLAINNMDYIRQSLPSFIKELGIDNVIQKLGEYRTNLEADRCSSTINAVIENALDTERNQIVELIEIVSHKMAPPMKLYLAEGAEVLHKDSNSMDQLMMYLESSLDTLYNTLNEVNFGRILESIWSELSIILYDLIQSNLDKRRPPAYFKNLKDTLQTMIYCFKMGNVATDVNILSTIQKRLDAYALETADLIHQYYIERLEYQKNQPLSPFGQLTIRAEFTDSSLLLTILNARNLLPMDSNGFVDSFTKACFMPTSRFNGISPVKTTVHHKSCFPLYDQEFCINLNEQQRTAEDSLILFSVKDKDLFGMSSQYIGECYASFTDLMESEGKQIIMNLSRPEYTDSETLRALEFRQGDKQAKDFIKKLKNKSYS